MRGAKQGGARPSGVKARNLLLKEEGPLACAHLRWDAHMLLTGDAPAAGG